MRLQEAKKIEVGDKVIVKDYQGEHEVINIHGLGREKDIGFWLDNGDLVGHKRIEKVIK